MKILKTDNTKIEIEVLNFTETGDKCFTINFGSKTEEIACTVPSSIVKSKFTDAAFARHILNFFIKD